MWSDGVSPKKGFVRRICGLKRCKKGPQFGLSKRDRPVRLTVTSAFGLSLVRERRVTPDAIWELKAWMLRQAGALKLHRGPEGFSSIGGLTGLKAFCQRSLQRASLADGRRPHGVLLLSPPGCGKSQFCRCLSQESGRLGPDRWSGFGGAGERPAGDERFSTAIEPWGNWGQWSPPGRWNFYSYWHTTTASPDGKYWGNGIRPNSQPDIQRGEWICVEFMIGHNTPGKNDGEQAYWIDGELRGHWSGFNWRSSPTLFANAFTLESYVTDRWTQNPENIVYFDNVVIAREYIGPSAEKR